MLIIDVVHSDSRPEEDGQPAIDNLDQSKLSADETVRLGQRAWNDVCSDRSWQEWLRVGAALCIGRAEAMHDARVNRPKGRSYNITFGAWLRRYDFHDIDPGDRARLFDVMDHRAEIEEWREKKLTPTERRRFNHPSTVWRKWKTAMVAPDPNRVSGVAKLKETNIELQEKLHRAERELSLGGGDLWTASDAPEDIATVMLVKLSPSKAERVAHTILKKLNDKKPSKSARSAVVEIGGAA